MAKMRTNNGQRDTAKNPVVHEPRSQGGIKRRQRVNWDARQEHLLLAVALRLSPVVPDFRAVADELGSDIFTPDQLRYVPKRPMWNMDAPNIAPRRRKWLEIDKRARAVLEERRQTSPRSITHDLEEGSGEESEEDSDGSSEPSSQGRPTPPSSQQIDQVSDEPESYTRLRQCLIRNAKKRTYGNENRQQGSPHDHPPARATGYNTPETSPNRDAVGPGPETGNRAHSPPYSPPEPRTPKEMLIPSPSSKRTRAQVNQTPANQGAASKPRGKKWGRQRQHRKQGRRDQHSFPSQESKPHTKDDNGRPQTMGGTQGKNIRCNFNMDVSAS